MLGTTICSTMWPSRSGGIPTPISEPSKVTRNRILLLLLPCNPYQVAPPLTMTSDNKGVNTFLGAQQQTLIKFLDTNNTSFVLALAVRTLARLGNTVGVSDCRE